MVFSVFSLSSVVQFPRLSMMFRAALLLVFAVSFLSSPVRADGVADKSAELAILRAARLPADDTSLLAFLNQRAAGTAKPEQIGELIARLRSPRANERARAVAELLGVGPSAVPALRVLASDLDAVGSAAARACLKTLDNDSSALTGAVLRLLAARRPVGAAAAVLAFLPQSEDAGIVEEAIATLAAVGLRGRDPDRVVLQALEDPVGLRRAAAVDVLCLCGPTQNTVVRRVLHDPVPAVRLRAARALVRSGDPDALATLIALLPELPARLALQAEESLIAIAAEQAPAVLVGDDLASRTRCRDAWLAWWQKTLDPAPYLDQVRKRVHADLDRDKVQDLIRGLGDDSFDVRQRATDELKAMGPAVAPTLRKLVEHPDLEVRQRTQTLLQEIEKEAPSPLSLAVPRILALRKPAAAAEVLLAYLPFADDDNMVAEVQTTLNAIAFQNGKPDPVILKALGDKAPARRAAAGEALAAGDAAEVQEAVHALLKDPDSLVRVKVALAVARTSDRTAVPVVIALTGDTSAEVAAQAESYLSSLRDDRPPTAVAAISGSDAAARKARRDAWSDWWKLNGDRVELSPRSSLGRAHHYLGYTLLVQSQSGIVSEIDAAGQLRWQIAGLAGPRDAQVLPGDRVLITESSVRRVTERNHKGDILWQKEVASFPISAARLPDGHTFIVSRNRVCEVDRSGRELFSLNRPGNDVMTAQKMRDGRIAIVSSQSSLIFLDAGGREVKTVRLPGVSSFSNEVLPGGGLLLPLSWQNKVIEYDDAGRVVWESLVPQPVSASRLPNGHTLVVTQQSPPRILEIDHTGKKVAESSAPPFVQRATRR
jgi:HEAT repeat protein